MDQDSRAIDVKKFINRQNYEQAPSLKLKDVGVYFKDKVALQEINLEVDPGEFLVLLGPSGSGKSTLLRVIAGIQSPSSGEVFIGSRLVAGGGVSVGPQERGLGMVFQDYALWPHMTVGANVAFALKRKHQKSQIVKKKVSQILERVGLESKAENYPNELSGGEQQRVALARALVADPGLLLFDEPLSNLDADLRERLRIEISTLCREAGATVVYITHDQSEAFALADKVGILQESKLLQLDKPEVIYQQPISNFVARFTGISGELNAYITKVNMDSIVVAIGRVDFEIKVKNSQNFEPATFVKVLVRPSAVNFLQSCEHGLEAIVVDVAFRGRGYDHVVSLNDGGRLVGVFSPINHPRDTKVYIGLDTQGCMVFPKDDFVSDMDLTESFESRWSSQDPLEDYLGLWLPQD